ncbi:erbb2 interacting protein [Phyllostomus discolor]|uniref:Erbb2 interacting protein n=1 Tax=Phyllostomus discolor TaxID=89673 RepID=A0A834B6D1_9CHIR|nr:erbb2 interacting protein [Phyllostomus discolor]
MLSRSFNSNFTAVSNCHYGSSRDLHGSQGSLALSVADGRGSGGHIFRIRVRVEKDPELGFSISGGVGGRGNPFKPDDDGIFVTRVQPEGPASKLLQPGDKIIQANGYSFINIEHGQAVSLLKTFQNTVELIIVREISS